MSYGDIDAEIPVGPILSMKEIAEEQSLRATGTVVEVDHPTRGPYLTVGNPIKMSDSIPDVRRSLLLGEHTDEVLREVLHYSDKEIGEIKASGAISAPEKKPRRRSYLRQETQGRSGVFAVRIAVHGQQAFGKAVLEALIKRDENRGVYVAPEKEGAKADPVKEAALAAKLPAYRPDSCKKPAVWDDVFGRLGELADPGPTTFCCW